MSWLNDGQNLKKEGRRKRSSSFSSTSLISLITSLQHPCQPPLCFNDGIYQQLDSCVFELLLSTSESTSAMCNNENVSLDHHKVFTPDRQIKSCSNKQKRKEKTLISHISMQVFAL